MRIRLGAQFPFVIADGSKPGLYRGHMGHDLVDVVRQESSDEEVTDWGFEQCSGSCLLKCGPCLANKLQPLRLVTVVERNDYCPLITGLIVPVIVLGFRRKGSWALRYRRPDEEVIVQRVYPGQSKTTPTRLLVSDPFFPGSKEKEEQGDLDGLREAAEVWVDLS